ncbi:DUF2567 domain-containing protein [Nocardia asteroides]|uniref:DUF2567 domain-containing protein n=1 Tax=Nocardia asteroides TaxID=1824 RepID=UPI001E42FF07|nr:DUF2567 domain-containing protein [Nocardia asteroides]UGT60772.1 DUF2567 domain-containing protein [Nocardia asteroides]
MRRELRGALAIAVGVLVAGALLGVAWGFLAPAERLVVVTDGRGAPLTGESLHRFDALAIFVCFGAGLGLVSAVAAWRARSVRGPLVLLALLLGSAAGAYAMADIGELVAEVRNPRPDDPVVGQIVTLPAEVEAWQALLIQPLLAGLVVLFLAALSTAEDLGTGFTGPFGESEPVLKAGADPDRPAAEAYSLGSEHPVRTAQPDSGWSRPGSPER